MIELNETALHTDHYVLSRYNPNPVASARHLCNLTFAFCRAVRSAQRKVGVGQQRGVRRVHPIEQWLLSPYQDQHACGDREDRHEGARSREAEIKQRH